MLCHRKFISLTISQSIGELPEHVIETNYSILDFVERFIILLLMQG